MKLTTKSKRYVDEPDYGVYVWVTSEGKYVMDEDENFLSINSMRGDTAKMEKLKRAARECGVDDGFAKFNAGHRKVTDDEFEEMRQRLLFGLNPDPLDVGAIKHDMEVARRNGSR